MSRYSGPQERGAARRRRALVRLEAEKRNVAALAERRASFRRERARIRAALDERELALLSSALGGGRP